MTNLKIRKILTCLTKLITSHFAFYLVASFSLLIIQQWPKSMVFLASLYFNNFSVCFRFIFHFLIFLYTFKQFFLLAINLWLGFYVRGGVSAIKGVELWLAACPAWLKCLLLSCRFKETWDVWSASWPNFRFYTSWIFIAVLFWIIILIFISRGQKRMKVFNFFSL